MFANFVVKKILALRGKDLLNYFDDLEIESVIPKLLHFVLERAGCENVVWIRSDEFHRLLSLQGEVQRQAEPEQLLYRHIEVQAIRDINEGDVGQILAKFHPENYRPQKVVIGKSAHVLMPLNDPKKHKPMAYFVLLGVSVNRAEKVMTQLSRDLAFMAKHVAFSLQLWAAQRMSYLDDLTGLFNQKYMGLVLESEIHRSQRDKQKFSVLFMDVDYFKSVNDSRGHWVGSRLLVEIGRVLQESLRKSDYAFRYGGDEFVVVLPQTDGEHASQAAERIRSVIEKTDFLIDGEHIKLTLSIGLAVYPDHAQTYKDIVKMADEAMYCGKNKSRNVVFVAS